MIHKLALPEKLEDIEKYSLPNLIKHGFKNFYMSAEFLTDMHQMMKFYTKESPHFTWPLLQNPASKLHKLSQNFQSRNHTPLIPLGMTDQYNETFFNVGYFDRMREISQVSQIAMVHKIPLQLHIFEIFLTQEHGCFGRLMEILHWGNNFSSQIILDDSYHYSTHQKIEKLLTQIKKADIPLDKITFAFGQNAMLPENLEAAFEHGISNFLVGTPFTKKSLRNTQLSAFSSTVFQYFYNKGVKTGINMTF